MAMTTYLLQTAMGVWLFHGTGLGLIDYTNPAINAMLTIPAFALQVVFSKWWLKHFSQGPVEWLWRNATTLSVSYVKKFLNMNGYIQKVPG